MRQGRELRLAVRVWREVCEHVRRAHEQAELMAARADEKAQRRVIVAWLASVKADGHARQLLLRAHLRRRQRAVLLAACAAWRSYTNEPTVRSFSSPGQSRGSQLR